MVCHPFGAYFVCAFAGGLHPRLYSVTPSGLHLSFFLQLFDEVVDAVEFSGDADALGAVGFALAAADAVLGLTEFLDGSVETDEVFAPVTPVFG